MFRNSSLFKIFMCAFLFMSSIGSQAQDNDLVSFELTEEKIEDAMRILSDATGFNILLSNQVTGTITAYVVEMSSERALRETVEVNGYHYVKNDNVVWVLADEEYFEDFNLGRERRVIRLEHAHARELESIVTEIVGPTGQVLVYPATNVLVVAAVPDRFTQVEAIVQQLDVPEMKRVFQLQHASAPILLQLLQAHVAAPERMYADFRTNQISVSGTQAQLDAIEKLLEEFDKPDMVITKTIRLRYAKARVVSELLREVLTGRSATPAGSTNTSPSALGGSRQRGTESIATASPSSSRTLSLRRRGNSPPSRADTSTTSTQAGTELRAEGVSKNGALEGEGTGLGPLANVTADTRTNSIIITHTKSIVARLEAIVKEIDVPSEFHTYQFLNVNPADIDIEGGLLRLFDTEDAYVNVDPLMRIVTFRCGPERATEIYKLLRAWDGPIRQVRIDAEILSVNVSVIKELGISWQAIMDDPTASLSVLFPPGIATGAPQGIVSVGDLATNDYTAALQALATDSDTQTIASPRILVRDGRQAVFSSARDEPFTVVTVDGDTNTTLQDVRFLNVGVNLSVTPTINQEDLVTLDVLLEISELVEVRNDIPVVDRSTAQSSISVRHGGTAILGGLRQRSRGTVSSGVPILRKIPIFGALFRNKRNDDSEFEILLILRPFIIDEPNDAPPSIDEIYIELNSSLKNKSLN